VNQDAQRQQQFQEMLQRPDIDQVTARYEQMRTQIRERLTTELGLSPWQDESDSKASDCRDYPAVEGADKESRFPSTWTVNAAITDEKWPHAITIIDEVARSYGFESPPRVIVDRPGDHEVTMADQYGADLIFGTKAATILSLRTGCHLTAVAHKRATPTIPEFGR
jgi:predicted LppA-like lipoprotein